MGDDETAFIDPRVTVSILTLVAGLIRFWNIGMEAIWLDESVSYLYARMPVWELIPQAISSDPHPPLYYLLLHYWIDLFGVNPIALRGLSAVLATLTVPVMYGVGRRLTDDHRAGLYAALITTVAVPHVWAAQEARMYGLLALATALSFYTYLRLKADKTRHNRLAYAVSLVLLGYSHYYGLFTLGAHAALIVAPVVTGDRDIINHLRQWGPSVFAAGVGLLPVLVAPLWMVFIDGQTGQLAWIDKPGTLDLPRLAVQWLVYDLDDIPVNTTVLMLAPVLAAGILYVGNDPEDAEPTTLAWMIVPSVAGFVLSFLAIPIFHLRYTVGAALGLYALLGARLASISGRPVRLLLATGLVLAMIVPSVALVNTESNTEWDKTSDVIFESGDVRPTIVGVPGYSANPVKYYAATEGVNARFISVGTGTTPRSLYQQVGTDTPFWIIVGNVNQRGSQQIYNVIERVYDVQCVNTVDGIIVARVVEHGAHPEPNGKCVEGLG